MNTETLAQKPDVEQILEKSGPPAEPRTRIFVRFCVAALVSAFLCLVVWALLPKSLAGRIDIVGYPTFFDYNFNQQLYAYRLIVDVLPVLMIIFYALLARFGPLRRLHRTPSRSVRLLGHPADPSENPEPSAFSFGVLPRIAVPAGVVVIAAASGTGGIGVRAILAGLCYVAAVAAATGLWWWAFRGRQAGGEPVLAQGLAWANGVGGAVAAVLAVWVVSRHTWTYVGGVGRQHQWISPWLVIAGALAVIGWAVLRSRQGWSARRCERKLLVFVVGSIGLFLAISKLPGTLGGFQGFDDAQELAGWNLVSQGYFPYTDLLFIHGFLPDVLRGTVGMSLFGDSVWGSLAGQTVLLFPLLYVSMYLYAAWVTRGNTWLLSAVAVSIFGGLITGLDIRFMFVPLTLILLGETLRRRSAIWCVFLVAALFLQAVLAPETSFLAIPALLCVVGADVLHRDKAVTWWKALRCTRWSIATGIVAILALVAFLSLNGALSAFIDYYIVFGPGHNEAGARPANLVTRLGYIFWAAGAVAVLATIWITVARIRRREDWTSQDWVAVAVAAFVAFYSEKALRFDMSHIYHVLSVSLPLIIWCMWKAMPVLDAAIQWSPEQRRWTAMTRLGVAPVMVLVVTLLITPYVEANLSGLGKQHSATYSSQHPDNPRVNYLPPGEATVGMLKDLETTLRVYAGDKQPVFDMTNSLGYFYYLLRREPGTRFVHVSMAIPPYAQQLLIDELKRSKPPVVVFDSKLMGLPEWDGINNDVRHYEVSQYILDEWAPVLRTHGNMILVRKELIAKGLGVPSLSETPQTEDLWFAGRRCDWGAAPNFLKSAPAGTSVSAPVRNLGNYSEATISGEAHATATSEPVGTVVVANGSKAVGTISTELGWANDPNKPGAQRFFYEYEFSGLVSGSGDLAVYLLGKDGTLHPVRGSKVNGTTAVQLADGRSMPIADEVAGTIERTTTSNRTVGQIEVPADLRLADFDLATFSAGSQPLGQSNLILTDDIAHLQLGHQISAVSLGRMGPDLAVRVGSCLPWQGFDAHQPLYIVQDGGAPATTVTLSGVRSQTDVP